MRIAVDIDDTLSKVDRISRPSAYIARNLLPYKVVDPNAHFLEKVYDWDFKETDKFIKEGGGIAVFTDAPAREGAREVLEKLRAEGDYIIILTARMADWFSNPALVSRDWLEKRKIPYDEIVADVWEKGEYCARNNIDILIEDNLEICKKAQALGINAVLFVDKHNIHAAREVKYGGANWAQIEAAVKYIKSLK